MSESCPPVKAVAFYLPQFHVIPENEEVYGKNFTEWDNVRNARPLFEGHEQPATPHKVLGYYDLTNEKSLTLQHHLAYTNGIEGFCYYYYNISGKKLLDKPLKIINQSQHIQNKFCLCWDHSSWYNNHSGQKREPFIEQVYSPQNAYELIQDLEQYFTNPRYIKIDGKPLFLVFAPERHPCIQEYARIWREEAQRLGMGEICLAGVEAFEGNYPSVFGFDCMVEFAPNWDNRNAVSLPGELPRRLSYTKTVADMLTKDRPPYNRIRCAFPWWDNTPRRGKYGVACAGKTPEGFEYMVKSMAYYTKNNLPASMQYLFINAWNEWGESCYLEPDEKYGFEYLNIVRNVLEEVNNTMATDIKE